MCRFSSTPVAGSQGDHLQKGKRGTDAAKPREGKVGSYLVGPASSLGPSPQYGPGDARHSQLLLSSISLAGFHDDGQP